MPYPETAEGFCVTDIKNWSKFTKQEVGRPRFLPAPRPHLR